MFKFTRSEIEQFAQASGYTVNALEKTLRLMDILEQLSKHPFLKSCFALKGGTALNLFYFNLPRLSVDADLNYIKEIDREKMHSDRREIDELIPRIFSKEYTVKFSKNEYALSQFGLAYRTQSGSNDRIKLEINYLHRQPVFDITEIESHHFSVTINYPVIDREELFAGKIIALLSRYTPRDLFDVYYIIENKALTDINKLRQLIIYYGLVARESIFDLFDLKLDTISKSDIRRHLYPMLIGSYYPDTDDMKQKVTDSLKPLLRLSQTEISCIEEFYSKGELLVKGLFDNATMALKILISPAFLWKKENIKKQLK